MCFNNSQRNGRLFESPRLCVEDNHLLEKKFIFHQVSVLLANYIYLLRQSILIDISSTNLFIKKYAVFYHDFFIFQENSNIFYNNNLSITKENTLMLIKIFSTTLEKFFLVPKYNVSKSLQDTRKK
ncbi:hypothetical protein pb186bvf_003301 [Paramecium bursaria]